MVDEPGSNALTCHARAAAARGLDWVLTSLAGLSTTPEMNMKRLGRRQIDVEPAPDPADPTVLVALTLARR